MDGGDGVAPAATSTASSMPRALLDCPDAYSFAPPSTVAAAFELPPVGG